MILSLTKSRLSGKTLFFIFTACFLSSFLYSTIINVPADQSTIQAGINAAATYYDTVLVQPGTYYENINYNGKNITVGSLYLTTQDTSYISSTVIDGDSIDSVVTFENAENSSAVLSGFTITNGFSSTGGGIKCNSSSSPNLQHLAISGNSADIGGGLYCNASHPSLSNITISDNSVYGTYGRGGGFHCRNYSNPILQNVTITGNSVSGTFSVGGGIYCEWYSYPSLQNVTISGNSASRGGGIYYRDNSNLSFENATITNNSADYGGGIYLAWSSSGSSLENLTISDNSADYGGGIYCDDYISSNFENLTISGNSANYNGGGIYFQDNSSLSFENLTISGNSANYSGGGIYFQDNSSLTLQNVTVTGNSADIGGGVYCNNSSPSLQNVTITNNSAAASGGGIHFISNSNPSLGNVTITGNSADTNGGGIYCNDNSNLILQNVTIAGNSASSNGGGINCGYYSNLSLEKVTISGNSATVYGGGIYCSQSSMILINSILWNDSPQEIYAYSDSVTATYSDIEGGWTGTGNIDDDPFFIDPANGNYQLQPTSPCIDAGDPASSLDPDSTIADMGAYFFNQYNGSIWHISTTGSDITGCGSEQYPFATIQHGINYSADTDTVIVQPGTYVENINYNGKLIKVGSLFLTTQDTTYISSTIINGNSSGSVVTFNNGENSTTDLCGFTILNGSATYGGGIYCDISSPSLQNLTITGNSASSNGGGIYCDISSPSLQNVTITNNSAFRGGGIYCEISNPSLQNVTITDNSATTGGGIYCYYYSNPSLEDIIISGNSATMYGGGIYCSQSNASLQNVIILSNSANHNGGGIYFQENSCPSLRNVTIIDNSATTGGGIYCNMSWIVLINSILWNDSPQEIYIESGSVTATYSDIEGGWTGTGNIDSDPLFVDPGNNNYHLLYDSPCINTGDPASPLDPDSTIADMGAYYFHIPQHFGPVWHISTTGSDTTGNGTEPYPFATLQHGINFSTNLDTVLVQPGTYVENIDYNGKLITVGSLFLTTTDTTYISSTIIDGDSIGSVVTFNSGEDTTAVLSGFTITNGSNAFGGGINCYYSSSPNLRYLTISGNSASSFGGGINCYNDANPCLQNITIAGNSADRGGGVYCADSSPSLENVTISGNTADTYGGGVYCRDVSNPSLQNITIANNSAGSSGGGINCYNNASPVLINTILWNDTPQEITVTSASVTVTYSDIEGGWAGTGNIDSDPLFVDPGNGNYHLQLTSPCIDAGDPASPLDPDGTIADMGAYYFHQTIPPDPPQNVTVEIIGTDVHLSWDAVTGANSYKVYSSDNPYTGFVEDTSGSFAGESWSAPIGDVKKFYYVIASTETIRSKVSDLQDAYQPGRRSRRYDSDKFINRKRK